MKTAEQEIKYFDIHNRLVTTEHLYTAGTASINDAVRIQMALDYRLERAEVVYTDPGSHLVRQYCLH